MTAVIEVTPDLECLDSFGDEPCSGAVEYRMPLSGTGRAFARCDHHWHARLEVQREIDERYPVLAPHDFDPLDAGEAWGPEDY